MRVVTILVSLLALLAGSAVAGQLTPGLEAYLLDHRDAGSVKALLVLDDQVDVTALDLDLHLQRTTLAERHFRVVTELQEKARITQGPLLAALDARLGADVASYKAYWLINAVRVTATEDAIRDLAARDDIDVADVNLVAQLIDPVEKTEVVGKARGIGIAPGIAAVGARRVWDELGIRGEGALIGSLDTGVDGNHPALADRWRGNFAPASEAWLDVIGSNPSFPTDGNGHGTHTTGTMAGIAADDTIGIAPASQWIASNAINQGANPGFDQDIIDCFEWFTDPDGNPSTMADVPDVVQNSWGVNENFSGYVDCDSRWWSVIDACEAAGVVVTWSAGNEGPGSQTLRSPADRATTLYNCFSVGSTQYYAPYNISGFSSRGPAGPNCGPAENRVKPEISAPGSDIYSAWPGGSYQYLSGTSMSAPHVAGVVALMRSANPNVDVITIKQVLMDTADDLGNPGEDNTYGHGFLDAYEAVLAVAGGLGYVEGTVEDRGTGDPIEGAVISVDGGFQSDVTEADGSYRLTLPIGSVTINAAAFGYADYSVTVEVEEDLTTNQDLRLDALPSATVTGTVFSAGSVPGSGTPADGAVVEVADTPLASVTTGADGAFSFQLPVGTDYEFRASVSGAGAISQTAPVDADTHLELYLSALTQDGFETGNFNALSWLTNGDANWYVQGAEVHSGAYAARSGDIGNQDNSNLQVTVDCGAGGEVSFWYKVSSEANYDYLEFYVDGSLRAEWAGEVGWAEHTTTVTGGNHTFRWNYDKDWSVSDGQDCGWIDDVTFPGGASPTPLCVPAPWSYAVTLDAAGTITLPLVIMNQGAVALEATATTAGVPWVSIANGAATVAPYTYHAADVIIDADGLAPGDYSAQIDIASNDPANPTVYVDVALTVTGDVTAIDDVPHAFQLTGAVPNPFNPQTSIHYALPTTAPVTLRLYDVQGRLVRTLVEGIQPAGAHQVRWDGRDDSGRASASGTYFARLTQGGSQQVKSLVLVR